MFESKSSKWGAVVSRPIVTGTAILVLLAVTGCESDIFKSRFFVPPPYVISSHGEAMAQNNAVHIANPNPAPRQHPPNLNGARARVAISRYLSNREIQPSDPGVVGGGGND